MVFFRCEAESPLNPNVFFDRQDEPALANATNVVTLGPRFLEMRRTAD